MKKKTILGLPISVIGILLVTLVGAGALVAIYWSTDIPTGAITVLGVSGWVTEKFDLDGSPDWPATYAALVAHTPCTAPDMTINLNRDVEIFEFIVAVEYCDIQAPDTAKMLIELVGAPAWVLITEVHLLTFDKGTQTPSFVAVATEIDLAAYEFVMDPLYYPWDAGTTYVGFFVVVNAYAPMEAPKGDFPLDITVSIGNGA